MHDPFLKSVFADRRMVGILIRRHVPEWADEIDVATLREEPNELVAGKTLERRDPDLYHGDADLDAFMVERMDTMLELREYPDELKVGGARTMAEMVDRFQRSLDELVKKGMRQGIQEGMREGIEQGARQGRTQVLRRQAARRFGEEAAGRLSRLLEELSDPEVIDKVTDALMECGTGEEFIERARMP